jgi:hypothetical protein
MEKEIKVGGNTFVFNTSNILDVATLNYMRDWCNAIKKRK